MARWSWPTAFGSGSTPCPWALSAPPVVEAKEVRSWMNSLSSRPYELFPVSKRKRAQGSVGWMLEEVTLRTGYGYSNPFPNETWDSVPDLWAAYVAGYLSGAPAPQCTGGAAPVCIV